MIGMLVERNREVFYLEILFGQSDTLISVHPSLFNLYALRESIYDRIGRVKKKNDRNGHINDETISF